MSLTISALTDPLLGTKDGVFSSYFVGAGFDSEVTNRGNSFAVTGLPPGVTFSGTSRSTTGEAVVTVTHASDLVNYTAHGLAVGRRVRFASLGSLPAPLVVDTDYYVIASGYTVDNFKVSTTLGGSVVDITDAGTGTHYCAPMAFQDNVGTIAGTPTQAGVFTIEVSYSGYVSGVPSSLTEYFLMVIEGDGFLKFYHVDASVSPSEVRNAVDLQYNARSRTFASGAFDVDAGLELRLGEVLRVHALVTRNGVYTLADGTPSLPPTAPSDIALTIRPKNMRDAAPFFRASEADGEEDMSTHDGFGGAGTDRPVPYWDIAINSARLRRLFRQLNATPGAETASIYIECEGDLAFTLDGRRHVSPPFPVNIHQPYTR